MIEDAELLRCYADEKSEEAFAEIVQRRIGLVYAVALRHTRDAQRAEDVTQRVFTDLARKAAALRGRPVLVGWLYRSAQFAASDAVRAERRRQAREEEAIIMQQIAQEASEPDWDKLRPVLDEVLNGMDERDRDAVLLRFFDGRPFAEIGERLRLSENTARMRVERALEKMRAALARRGVTSTTAALVVAFGNQAGIAAPAGLAASVTGAALAGATGGGVTVGGAIFAMSKIKVGIVSAIVIAATVPAIVEVRANRALSAEAAALRAGGGELAALRKESKQLGDELARLAASQPSADELGRLRARVAALQKRPAGVTDGNLKPAASWTNRGWATPEAALETVMWTSQVGNTEELVRNMRWIGDAREPAEAAFAKLPEVVRARYGNADRLLGEFSFGSRGKENDELMQRNYGKLLAYQVIDVTVDLKREGMQVRWWEQMASGHEREKANTFSRHGEQFGFSENRWSDQLWQSMVDQIDPATGAFRPRKLVPMDPETGRPVQERR